MDQAVDIEGIARAMATFHEQYGAMPGRLVVYDDDIMASLGMDPTQLHWLQMLDDTLAMGISASCMARVEAEAKEYADVEKVAKAAGILGLETQYVPGDLR